MIFMTFGYLSWRHLATDIIIIAIILVIILRTLPDDQRWFFSLQNRCFTNGGGWRRGGGGRTKSLLSGTVRLWTRTPRAGGDYNIKHKVIVSREDVMAWLMTYNRPYDDDDMFVFVDNLHQVLWWLRYVCFLLMTYTRSSDDVYDMFVFVYDDGNIADNLVHRTQWMMKIMLLLMTDWLWWWWQGWYYW